MQGLVPEIGQLHDLQIGFLAHGLCHAPGCYKNRFNGVVIFVGKQLNLPSQFMNGFHADTPEDWSRRLTELLDSRDLRRSMGVSGHERAARLYSTEALTKPLADALRSTAR